VASFFLFICHQTPNEGPLITLDWRSNTSCYSQLSLNTRQQMCSRTLDSSKIHVLNTFLIIFLLTR